ncbi:LysR family transcriptional regulator [Enterobacter mori]|uniref:LysR family transcriptional regulator n=1 Tax=Enterobacter mori TaxID=539813 RepID=UPI003D65B207
MELQHLRCFLTVAETLHFGEAAHRLDMLPSALGRNIRLLEEALGTRLFTRSTRRVALTENGILLREEARKLLAHADAIMLQFRQNPRRAQPLLRVGTIDSAAIGLLPGLLKLFRQRYPEVEIQLYEDKTVHLLPKLKSGRLDLVFIRPPSQLDTQFERLFLCHEPGILALPSSHPFADRDAVEIRELEGMPMILPERRSRPHSHDLTMNLFQNAGIKVTVSQMADEKQTIINLVAAGIGLAIVPAWSSRFQVAGVKFVQLTGPEATGMPLEAVWMHEAQDEIRDTMLTLLKEHPELYG